MSAVPSSIEVHPCVFVFWNIRLVASDRPSSVAFRSTVPGDAFTTMTFAVSSGWVESLPHATRASVASEAALRTRVLRYRMYILRQLGDSRGCGAAGATMRTRRWRIALRALAFESDVSGRNRHALCAVAPPLLCLSAQQKDQTGCDGSRSI